MAKRMKGRGKHYAYKSKHRYMSKSKRIDVYVLILACLLVLLVTSTNKIFAYLTDSNSRTNKFTIGSTYTVIFDSNGGTGTMENQSLAYDSTGVLTANTFTREEYNFLGWNTMPDGTGTSYDDEEEVINLPTDSNDTITLYAQWVQGVAMVNGTLYDSLQEAITKGVPNDKTETVVKLLKNVSENITINNGKNVVLNLQSYTLSNNGNNPVIVNKGILEINNGKITTDAAGNGAINNESTGNIKISGGQVIATGGKQALYNNKGTAEISGDAYLSSVSTARAAVQNQGGGTLNILGGTIVSTGLHGVENSGTMSIGIKDGELNLNSPVIIGKDNGLKANAGFKFFDGIIKGKNKSISDLSKVTEREGDYGIATSEEVIDGATYKTAFLGYTKIIQFNTSEGFQSETTRYVIAGSKIGTLPVPVKSGRIFDGWFTASKGGTQITEDEIVTRDATYYAHWHKTSEVAQIGDVIYDTIEDAVKAVPTNGTQTTIKLLKDASETITVEGNKNIVFDFGDYTLRNCWNTAAITNKAKVTIVSGTITSNADTAAINNEGGALLISGGSVIATGTRQAVYVASGSAEITGSAYLSSTASGTPTTTTMERGTAQCLAGATLKVTGGTIVGNVQQAISNDGTLIIGVDDGTADATTPEIIGKTCGIKIGEGEGASAYFYDGIIKGVTDTIIGTYEYDENFTKTEGTETINGTNYKTLCLTDNT